MLHVRSSRRDEKFDTLNLRRLNPLFINRDKITTAQRRYCSTFGKMTPTRIRLGSSHDARLLQTSREKAGAIHGYFNNLSG